MGARGSSVSRLLVLTNGAGEDAIAARILAELAPEVRSRVVCCPLVGAGHALADYENCGPRVEPPSAGLFRESWRLAVSDLLHGVLKGHFNQLRFLREVRDRVGMTLAVGDLFPVLMSVLGGSRKTVFVGTAKSVYHHRYSWPEREVLKRWVQGSLVRDPATAAALQAHGVKAQWLGNAMMDEVQPQGLKLPLKSGPVLTLFPGSRAQAPAVLSYQLQVVSLLAPRVAGLQVGVALAPGTEVSVLVAPSVAQGWEYSPGHTSHHLGSLRRDGLVVELLQGALGDLLSLSLVALGQAGTANEQAAGAGVPVVAYDPRGERGLKWYRKRQKGLLGDAVSVVPERPEAIVEELLLLFSLPSERSRRAAIGRERMGPAGGSARMAEAIGAWWRGQD